MILSRRWRLVFIKGRKVGGTSVEMALSELAGPADIVTPITPVDERARLARGARPRNYGPSPAEERAYLGLVRRARPERLPGSVPATTFYNHMPLTEVLTRAGPLDGYQVWCCERSPYAKVISWANMRASFEAYRTGGAMAADPASLQRALDQGLESGKVTTVRNIDLYRDSAGELAARALRCERLGRDYLELMAELGVARPPPLPHAKRGLMSERLDPRQVLRPDQLRRINQLFAEEFAVFGYRPVGLVTAS